jgi:hypothetical protein
MMNLHFVMVRIIFHFRTGFPHSRFDMDAAPEDASAYTHRAS